MGTDSMTLGTGIFYDGNGTPIGTGTVIDDIDEIPPYADSEICTLTKNKAAEFSAEAQVDTGLLEKLVEVDLANNNDSTGYTLQYRTTRLEQIRRHKKKRINKKWAKRYGYREVPYFYIFKNAYIEPRLFNDFSVTSFDFSCRRG